MNEDARAGSTDPDPEPDEDHTDDTGRRGTTREEHTVRGERLLETVKRLIHEGNVRRIIIKNEEGRTLIEVPLTLGVVGTALVPVWAAIGAIAALVANCSIVVVRAEEIHDDDDDGEDETGA
jgi:hypothetical protein